jgi:hypothetical protein
MPLQPATYHSYLVRLWQESSPTGWLAMAQSVQTGKVIHFSDVESLCAFLREQVALPEKSES